MRIIIWTAVLMFVGYIAVGKLYAPPPPPVPKPVARSAAAWGTVSSHPVLQDQSRENVMGANSPRLSAKQEKLVRENQRLSNQRLRASMNKLRDTRRNQGKQ